MDEIISMKRCIWCLKSEDDVSFLKKAHTFPVSLGGKSLCDNVCDICNHYFGSPTPQAPSIEVVFKEIFNLSKHILLSYNKEKKLPRFKSEYFNFDVKKGIIRLKPRYALRQSFQEKLGRQFRRGMFKVFLEERERQRGDALDNQYNFIREFARYNLSDYPIYYFKPKLPVIFFSETDTRSPVFRFTASSDELDSNFKMFEYSIMSHDFAIPTSNIFEIQLDNYRSYLKKTDHPSGTQLIEIKRVEDIDFTFSFIHSNL